MARGLAPMRCTATSKRTHAQCEAWASPGAVVCWHHGAKIPRAVEKAEVRMTLAQLLKQDPRPLAVAMADAVSTADAIFRDARAHVAVDGDTNAQDMARLIEAAERVIKLGKTLVDAGVMVKLTEQHERDVEEEGRRVVNAVVALVDGLLDRLPIPPDDENAWRAWMISTAFADLHEAKIEIPEPPPLHPVIESGDGSAETRVPKARHYPAGVPMFEGSGDDAESNHEPESSAAVVPIHGARRARSEPRTRPHL